MGMLNPWRRHETEDQWGGKKKKGMSDFQKCASHEVQTS